MSGEPLNVDALIEEARKLARGSRILGYSEVPTTLIRLADALSSLRDTLTRQEEELDQLLEAASLEPGRATAPGWRMFPLF